MKKFRFFSVAVAIAMALSASAWAQGSVSRPVSQLIILNPPGVSNVVCYTMPGSANQCMKSITNIKGTVSSTTCSVYLQLIHLVGASQNFINEAQVRGNIATTSPNLVIPFLSGYPANGTYCIRLRAAGCSAGPVTLINGNVTFNWGPPPCP